MVVVESDQLLLLAAVAAAITLLSSVLVIAVRTRKVREQLLELETLRCSVQIIQTNLNEIVRIAARTRVGLQELSGVGLHFRQIKREQSRLSEKLNSISRAVETLGGVPQLRDELRGHNEEIKEIVEASRSLQEWRSRVTAVYSDAGHLFESEPVRELLEGFEPPTASYTARPPRRSEGRTRPGQKRVRSQRQR